MTAQGEGNGVCWEREILVLLLTECSFYFICLFAFGVLVILSATFLLPHKNKYELKATG